MNLVSFFLGSAHVLEKTLIGVAWVLLPHCKVGIRYFLSKISTVPESKHLGGYNDNRENTSDNIEKQKKKNTFPRFVPRVDSLSKPPLLCFRFRVETPQANLGQMKRITTNVARNGKE